MSSTELVACGSRSSDFGVITISGRCLAIRACLRSRWKYWARALVSVWQQQRQPRGLPPLGQPRHDELVDDHLRRVHKIAELRLPQHKRLRRLLAVAILEPHARELA